MSYKGHIIQLPIGEGGYNGSRNMAQVQPDELILANNISFESGTIRKEGGASKYNSSVIAGAPGVLAGWDWWPTTAVQRMVAFLSDGTLKKDSGAGTFGTTLVAGLAVSTVAVPTFCEGGKEAAANDRKLFFFNGIDRPQVLAADGVTTSNLSGPPADWSGANQPTNGFIHEGRLWAFGNLNHPHRVYYSLSTDHEAFTGAGSGDFIVYPGEGERLVGGISYKGVAVMWKYPYGIYVIDTRDPNTANWKVQRLTGGIGGVSCLGYIVIDDDILFLDQGGNFQLLSAVQEFGDLASKNLSVTKQMNQYMRDFISLNRLQFARGVYYAHKREAHFSLSAAGSTVNDRRIVVDFNRPGMPRFRYSERDTAQSIWLRKDTDNVLRPLIGDNSGFIWKLDQTLRNKDGAGYSSEFQSAHMDMSHVDPKLGAINKIGDFLECVVEPKGDWSLSVDIIWDGEVKQTVHFNMGVSGGSLGSFVIGTDVLGGDQLTSRRKRIVGSGRRFSLKARQNSPDQDFSVARFYLEFRGGQEKEP